jgi:antirestriction protein ArdC
MAAAYSTTSADTVKRTAYEVVTDRILAQLEAGTAPWHKPWGTRNADGSVAMPKNLISGKVYRGINLLLTLSAGYESQYWLTFKQAKDLGGHVKAGEHSLPITFWQFGKDTEEQDGETTERRWAFCRIYHIFNLQQCEIPGLDMTPSDGPKNTFNAIEACERVAAGYRGPDVKHGYNRACYMPGFDKIEMPSRETFHSPEEYYSTLFHEMTHSTGHPSRLKREGITEAHFFGDKVYSKEELVAEMGAAFLCGHTGIENKTIDNSASYIQSWLKVLRGDSKLVISAASAAQRAADLILGVNSQQGVD